MTNFIKKSDCYLLVIIIVYILYDLVFKGQLQEPNFNQLKLYI